MEGRGINASALRLFVAIGLPEAVKDRIEQVQRELQQVIAGKDIRWTKREQFHLTLKFLGNQEESRMQGLVDSLRTACQNFVSLSLRAKEIGFFPDALLPRVVWAGVNDARDDLPRLQQAVEAAVKTYTNEKPAGTFTGHVTLGRIQRMKPAEAESLAKLARSMAEVVFGDWVADKLELIRSELSSSGSSYTTLAALPFSSGF